MLCGPLGCRIRDSKTRENLSFTDHFISKTEMRTARNARELRTNTSTSNANVEMMKGVHECWADLARRANHTEHSPQLVSVAGFFQIGIPIISGEKNQSANCENGRNRS